MKEAKDVCLVAWVRCGLHCAVSMTENHTDASDGSRENQPTMDGARGALLPIAAGSRLRATQARCGCSVMPWGRPVKVPGEAVGWSFTPG